MVTSHLPIPHDPNSPLGKAQVHLREIASAADTRIPDRIKAIALCNEIEARCCAIRSLVTNGREE